MSRTLGALVLALMITPAIWPGMAFTADAPAAPAPSPHEGSLRISDFSTAAAANITLRTDGGAELAHAPGYWSAGFTVASAANTQGQPATASNSRGEFVVTWQDYRVNPKGIYMQRVDVNGNKLGGEVAVATGPGHKGHYQICVDRNDNILVPWFDWRSGVDCKIFIKRFDSYGNQNGSEMQVSWASGNQSQQSISADRAGNFVIAWSDDRLGNQNYDIYAQRYDFRGNRIGGEVLMCGAQLNQWGPQVLMFPEGGFMLAWGDGRNGQSYDIYMQKYDINGVKVGSEISVAGGSGDEFPRKLQFDSAGSIVMNYHEYFNTVGSDLYIQRFDQNGTKFGNRVKVNDVRKFFSPPIIALDSLDNIMCVYSEGGMQEYWIYAQQFDATGNKVGGTAEIVHDQYNLGWLDIAADTHDNFLLTYGNGSSDLSGLPYLQPHHMEGRLVIGPLAPQNLWAWTDLSAGVRSGGPPGHSVDFHLSTDGGASWQPVLPNGSLAPAGGAGGLLLRARLFTADVSSTPVLDNLTVNFLVNRPPAVTAGPDLQAPKNAPCNLTAAGSDPDGDGLRFRWSQTGGPPAQFSGADTDRCGFTPRLSGTYSFRVTANDGFNESAPALVNVSVENRLPSVSAGPDLSVQKGGTVSLSATGSDPDGDALEFSWNQTAGTPRYLERTAGAEVSFPAWAAGRFSFKASANDGEGESAPVFVNLTVWGRAPAAVLRVLPEAAGVGEQVQFNASGSLDPDGNLTAFNFRFGDGAESGWIPQSAVSHAYSSAGAFAASVSVRDDDGNESTSAEVNVSVTAAGAPRIVITNPREGESLSSRNVRVTFLVSNFTVAGDAGHIHFKLDDQPETMWYSTAPYELSNLSAGQHTLRAFLENAGHNRLPGPGSSAAVGFTISLQGLPDLAVTASDIAVSPAGAREGQTVTVSVRVYNIGQSDAGQFRVRFLVDGKALAEQTVLMLGRAQNIERQAAWKAQRGAHELKVIVDPEALVNESDEGNNEAKVTASIAPVNTSEKGLDPVWILLLLVIIIVGALGAAMLLRRGRRPGRAIPAPPPPAPAAAPPPQMASGQALFPPAPPPPEAPLAPAPAPPAYQPEAPPPTPFPAPPQTTPSPQMQTQAPIPPLPPPPEQQTAPSSQLQTMQAPPPPPPPVQTEIPPQPQTPLPPSQPQSSAPPPSQPGTPAPSLPAAENSPSERPAQPQTSPSNTPTQGSMGVAATIVPTAPQPANLPPSPPPQGAESQPYPQTKP